MSAFSEALAARKAQKAATPPDSVTVEVVLDGVLVTLKFYELLAEDWANITAACPPDLQSEMDRHYGYNIRNVAVLAAKNNAVVVEDGEEIKPRVVPGEIDEWDDLFAVIAGSERNKITDAVLNLNQYAPDKRVADAKKALAVALAAKRASPAKSASPSAASAGGNRAARRATSTRKAT
jgi:hypothetical protein